MTDALMNTLEQCYDYETASMVRGNRLPIRVSERLRDQPYVCAGCGESIRTGSVRYVRQGFTFHPPCAAKGPRTQAGPPAVPARTRPVTPSASTFAILSGVAVTLGQGGHLTNHAGESEYRVFEPGCFDASLARGGQQLRVNHSGARLSGAYMLLKEDAGALRFRFCLRDSALARDIVGRIRGGAIRYCSIGFSGAVSRDPASSWEARRTSRARLDEISLVDGWLPRWHTTSVRIERGFA